MDVLENSEKTLSDVIQELMDRVTTLERRLDSLTETEPNIRAAVASTLREMADDIDDDIVPARHHDPNEEDDE